MLPGGKLYVPGAEKLLPNIRKLTDAARRNEVFLVSHGCFHAPDDPEFTQFPPHCVKGTPGAEFVPEALADKFIQIENRPEAKLPADLFAYQQIILEKQTLDIFQSLHANELVERLGTQTRIRSLRSSHGILRRSRSQRPVATQPSGSSSAGCNRNAFARSRKKVRSRISATGRALSDDERSSSKPPRAVISSVPSVSSVVQVLISSNPATTRSKQHPRDRRRHQIRHRPR